MEVFKRMVRDHEEQKKREYELANPCTHRGYTFDRVFEWDGQTMCTNCCKHEYRDHIVNDDSIGFRVCTLCLCILGPIFRSYVLRPTRGRRKRIPKIRVFDENGKQRRVKYSPSPGDPGQLQHTTVRLLEQVRSKSITNQSRLEQISKNA